MIRYSFFTFFSFLFFCCNPQNEQQQTQQETSKTLNLKFAKRFHIKKVKDYTVLEILGNKDDYNVTASFVLYKNEKPNYTTDAYYVKIPVTRVACMSSIYTTMIEKLNSIKSIIAIDNVDYYNNAFIQNAVRKNTIVELSKGPHIELEKTLALKPDLLLTFGMGNPKNDIDTKLLQANIPIAISLDHLEETPLARFEWIKFIACFYDKEQFADSLFKTTEENYNRYKSIAQKVSTKPSVLTEMKYGDIWHAPGGKSFISHLIADAGGKYLWDDNDKTGSLPLSFENVYAKAKDCDYWINTYNINSKKELISYDERYALFKAFKENKIYNNNKTQNSKGFSNYWESGISNPDSVLADLIYIFHPDLFSNHTFTFYKKIE